MCRCERTRFVVRVLVVKLSSLGDLFHALPAVHNLKVKLGAEVDWAAQSEYTELVKCFTDVRRIVPYHRHAAVRRFPQLLKDLRAEEYDYVVDFQGLLKSAVISRLARGRKVIGPSFKREGAGLFYDAVAGERRKDRHAVEENLDVVRFLGLDPIPVEFPVSFPKVRLDGTRRRVGFLPSSRWATKNWPTRCFVDLGRLLLKTGRVSLYIIGGPADAEICARIEEGLEGGATNLCGKHSLPQTGGALKELDLLIANDSGPIHMAAAVGIPVLGIFGPTDPLRTGPYGKMHRIVRASLPCQPCFSRTCRRGDVPCLAGVTPERVSEEALGMLADRPV
ncbi:MAG: hypothetical protein C0404_03690 [Verrucomicrobia bacterium]|nr:hypothetical protein [Verrucomicrobiota bacterium]